MAFVPSSDTNGQLPSGVRARSALNIGNTGTVEGAAVSAAAIAAGRPVFAPHAGARPGNRTVFFGDSLTSQGGNDSIGWRGYGYPTYASILSGQRLRYVKNAGVAGNTSTQMLARFDTDVTPYTPNLVVILAGTNDAAQSVSLATYRANIVAIVAKCQAIGAKPALCLIPPTNLVSPADRKSRINAINTWLRLYSSDNGIDLVDFYTLLTDTSNGNWKSAYYSDGTHPNQAGFYAMGALAASVLSPVLPASFPLLPMDAVDPYNFILNPLFLSGSNPPTSWSNQGGVTGQTLSVDTGTGTDVGNWFKYTTVASSGSSILHQTRTTNPAGHSIVPGNRYACVGRIKAGAVSSSLIVNMRFTGGVTTDFRPVDQFNNTLANSVFYVEGVAPTGSTSVQIQLRVDAGTGDVSFAQIGVYDLTAMGVL